MTLAIPIGLLMIQLDILARFSNTYFQHRAERLVENGNFESAARMNPAGPDPTVHLPYASGISGLVFGSDFVNLVVNHLPMWLMNGLKTAGGILPSLGIAILLRYLPVSRNLSYLIVGFVLAAYLKVPVLGAALVGLAFAILSFQSEKDETPAAAQVTVNAGGEMGDE